jgi:hypothetical protein
MLPGREAISLFDLVPWLGARVDNVLSWPLQALTLWVGTHVFHLTGEVAKWQSNGVSDTTLDYVLIAIRLVLSAAGAAVWSVVSETRARRKEYRTAYAWLRLFLRFTLAITMLLYGFLKIFSGQFDPLGLYDLTQRYGDSTPMHLLWSFMAYSRPYTIFGGLMEAIPGALLLFRRTSTAGLLGAVAVMLNVVMLNFCYDVPVKLYSTHLLLIALFLLLPDLRPLWDFLLAHQSAVLTGVWLPQWERKPLRIGAHVLQGLIVVGMLYSIVWNTYKGSRVTPAPASPLQGAYAVDEAAGSQTESPWVRVVMDGDYLTLVGPDHRLTELKVKYDTKTQTMAAAEKDPPLSLHWSINEAGMLTLAGKFKGELVSMTLRKTPSQNFDLNMHRFHWVQEADYNH